MLGIMFVFFDVRLLLLILFTVRYSLAKRFFVPQSFRYRLAPRPLRAEGPSAPCSWPASAVLVTSDLQGK